MSTPRPADDGEGAIDWENVELREGRDTYLPEGGTPPPRGESRPEPGDTTPSPPENEPPAAEPATPDVAAPGGGTTYIIQQGDTLYDIAGRYGLTVAALASVNNLANPGVIFPGQVLAIPEESGSVAVAEPDAAVTAPAVAATPDVPGEGNAYTVRSGDNPYRIARRFGVPVQALMEINNITNPTHLKVGQVLTIPGADVTVPPPPPEPPAAATPTAAADGTYVVRRGDTLYEIARRFGTTTAALIAVNDLADPRRLDVGQVLVIPDAEAESNITPPPPSPTATAPPPTPVVEETPAPQETGFIWPVEGRNIAQYYRYGHGAIDILLPVGTPIVAAADGVVEFSGWNNYGYGWLTIVDHGNGFRTLYAHQSELLVEAEQEVKQGQLIGKSGHTGWSTHPHLHFEVILNNVLKDPCAYLPGGC